MAGEVQWERGCPEARSGRFSPGRMERCSACPQKRFFRPASHQAPGMLAELGPPSAFFLMREETEETTKSHKGCDYHRVPSAVGGHWEAKGAAEGTFRQRGRGSHGEDALKELEGQGRGALQAGGRNSRAGRGPRGKKTCMSSLPLPAASLQRLPHPAPELRAEEGLPVSSQFSECATRGQGGSRRCTQGHFRPLRPLPDDTLSLRGGRVVGRAAVQLSQMLRLLLMPRPELPTRDLRRAGRLSTLPQALGSS